MANELIYIKVPVRVKTAPVGVDWDEIAQDLVDHAMGTVFPARGIEITRDYESQAHAHLHTSSSEACSTCIRYARDGEY